MTRPQLGSTARSCSGAWRSCGSRPHRHEHAHQSLGAKVGLLLGGPLQRAVASRLPERLPIAGRSSRRCHRRPARMRRRDGPRPPSSRARRADHHGRAQRRPRSSREATVRRSLRPITRALPRRSADPAFARGHATPDPFVRVCTVLGLPPSVMSRFLTASRTGAKSGYARPLLVAQSTAARREWRDDRDPQGSRPAGAWRVRRRWPTRPRKRCVGRRRRHQLRRRRAARRGMDLRRQPTIAACPLAACPRARIDQHRGGSIASVASGG